MVQLLEALIALPRPNLVLIVGMGALLLSSRSWLMIHAWLRLPGTLAHELLHLAAGLICGARPVSLSVFPRRSPQGVVCGEVLFARLRWWNAIPVAMAPLLLLPAALVLFVRSTQLPVGSESALWVFFGWQALLAGWPSRRDLSHALVATVVIVVLIGIVALLWHHQPLSWRP